MRVAQHVEQHLRRGLRQADVERGQAQRLPQRVATSVPVSRRRARSRRGPARRASRAGASAAPSAAVPGALLRACRLRRARPRAGATVRAVAPRGSRTRRRSAAGTAAARRADASRADAREQCQGLGVGADQQMLAVVERIAPIAERQLDAARAAAELRCRFEQRDARPASARRSAHASPDHPPPTTLARRSRGLMLRLRGADVRGGRRPTCARRSPACAAA